MHTPDAPAPSPSTLALALQAYDVSKRAADLDAADCDRSLALASAAVKHEREIIARCTHEIAKLRAEMNAAQKRSESAAAAAVESAAKYRESAARMSAAVTLIEEIRAGGLGA